MYRSIKISVLVLMLASSSIVMAATPLRTLTVQVQGMAKATPRQANFSMSVSAIHADRAQASALAAQKASGLVTTLTGIGGKIKVSQGVASITKAYDYNQKDTNGNPTFLGWQVTQSVEVKTPWTKQSSPLLGQIFDAGIQHEVDVNGPFCNISEKAALGATNRAEKNAMKRATQLASQQASALGVTLGKVISASDPQPVGGYNPPVYQIAAKGLEMAGGDQNLQFDRPEPQTFTSFKQVTFQIK